MPSNLPNDIIKLTLALFKHQLELWLGKEFVGIAATQLTEIGGEKLQEFIQGKEGPKELLAAGQRADALFRERCTAKALTNVLSINFGDQSSVQARIKELPKSMNREELQGSIMNLFKRDFGSVLSEEQILAGSQLYTDCLLEALVPLEEYVLPAIGNMVSETLKELHLLRDEQRQSFKTVNEKLESLGRTMQRGTIEHQVVSSKEIEILPGALPPGS